MHFAQVCPTVAGSAATPLGARPEVGILRFPPLDRRQVAQYAEARMYRFPKALLAILVALQPLSMWTLLGVFGTDHTLRLVPGAGGFAFVLGHDRDRTVDHPHHHTAADALFSTSDGDSMGDGDHLIRQIQDQITSPKRTPPLPALLLTPFVDVAHVPGLDSGLSRVGAAREPRAIPARSSPLLL